MLKVSFPDTEPPISNIMILSLVKSEGFFTDMKSVQLDLEWFKDDTAYHQFCVVTLKKCHLGKNDLSSNDFGETGA